MPFAYIFHESAIIREATLVLQIRVNRYRTKNLIGSITWYNYGPIYAHTQPPLHHPSTELHHTEYTNYPHIQLN